MSAQLQEILEVCDSRGGISQITLTNVDNVTSGLNPEIIDPAQVYTIAFRKHTADYTEKSKSTAQNQKIIQTIKAFIPKRRLSMETLIKNIINKRIVVIYTDRDESGGMLYKAKFSYKYSPGKRLSENNGYDIEFSTEKLLTSLDYSGININLPDPGDPWGGGGGSSATDDCCVLINPTPLSYIPAATGNPNNRNEYVIGSNGVRYFIDKTGAAIPFPYFPQYFEEFASITTDRVHVTVATLPTSDIEKQVKVLRNGVEQAYTSGTPGDGKFSIDAVNNDIIFNRNLESWEIIRVYFSANT